MTGPEYRLAGGVVLEDDRQPVVLIEGKGAEDDRVDDREHRGAGPDPQRQDRERHGGESRRLPK